MSPAALEAALSYGWPGNIRELQNALQFAAVKCRGDLIEVTHLPPHVVAGLRERATAVGSTMRKPGSGEGRTSRLSASAVAEALRRSGGNKARAARILGVGRATLYRFFKREG